MSIPRAVPETDGVLLYPRVGSIHEHGFEIFNVFSNPIRVMAVRPVDDDVVGMALMETDPFLVAEHSVIQCVERLQVLSQGGLISGHTFCKRLH